MLPDILTYEIIVENDMFYGGPADSQWNLVESFDLDYDEGTVSRQYVYENTNTGKFWSFITYSNSWSDVYEEDEEFEVFEVEPRDVLVRKWFKVPQLQDLLKNRKLESAKN